MNECKYIGGRGDRYGSNSIPWISYIFLCKLNSYKLFHNCQRCKKYAYIEIYCGGLSLAKYSPKKHKSHGGPKGVLGFFLHE